MKTVTTQKIAIIPSSATHGTTLENLTAVAVLEVEVKEELVTQASRHSDRLATNSSRPIAPTGKARHKLLKDLRLALVVALGTSSLLLSPLAISAVVNLKTKAPSQKSSGPSPLAALASISNNLSQSTQADTDFIYPLVTPAPLTSPFGWRKHPLSGQQRLHGGVDFEAPHGAPIVAAISGQVVVANWHGGHGKTVVIERQGKFQTLYAHMSKILVQKGQAVKQGEVIGYVGSTGRSTGAHLHFETLLPGKDKNSWVTVDPEPGVRYALDNRQQLIQVSSISRTDSFN